MSLDGIQTEMRGCKAAAAQEKERRQSSGTARNCGIISQTVTVGPQITEGRVVHTGSAFLFFTVTAPTSVCLNWGFDTWRDYSLKSLHPRLHSSPFSIQRTDWDTESSETAHIVSVPPEPPPAAAAAAPTNVTHFTSCNKTDMWPTSRTPCIKPPHRQIWTSCAAMCSGRLVANQEREIWMNKQFSEL